MRVRPSYPSASASATSRPGADFRIDPAGRILPDRARSSARPNFPSIHRASVRSGGKWIVVLAVLGFIGYVIYGTVSRTGVSCEVCMEFDGRMVCRRGAGETEAEARTAAQESTCGGNAMGMTESTECRNRTPERVQCTTG